MTLCHLYLSIPKFLSGAAGNDTWNNIEKRPDSRKLFERKKHGIQLHYDNLHWLPDGACSVAGIFLTIVQISSEFVGGQCASWRLPPKAAVSAYGRHSFVEGIRNGGLDVTQNRRSTLKIHYRRTKLPALQRFFLSPSGGAG